MRASIAASATADPDTPPISVDSTMQTWASPPDIHDTRTLEQAISRQAMPVRFIMWPASTKNGTASSGKLCEAVATCCTPIDSGMISLVAKNEKARDPDREGDRNAERHQEKEGDGKQCHGTSSSA